MSAGRYGSTLDRGARLPGYQATARRDEEERSGLLTEAVLIEPDGSLTSNRRRLLRRSAAMVAVIGTLAGLSAIGLRFGKGPALASKAATTSLSMRGGHHKASSHKQQRLYYPHHVDKTGAFAHTFHAAQGEAEGSDDAVTLGLYGRMYYSEEDCEAEETALPDSSFSVSMTAGVCTAFVPQGEDDGTDDTYATLTCSDGIMYLKYYADSSCKYSVDEYEFTAGGTTCVEGTDEDSYISAYTTDCSGAWDDEDKFFTYSATREAEHKYAFTYLYQKKLFIHQELERMGVTPSEEAVENAKVYGKMFEDSLADTLVKTFGDNPTGQDLAVRDEMIKSFTSPIVFQYMIDHRPNRSQSTRTRKELSRRRSKKATRKAGRRGSSRSKGLFAPGVDHLNTYSTDALPGHKEKLDARAPTVIMAGSPSVISVTPSTLAATTPSPTKTPTRAPTVSPTKTPTGAPTKTPTKAPTRKPTARPTSYTSSPTYAGYDDDYEDWYTNCVYVGVTYSLLFWTGSYATAACADSYTKKSDTFYTDCTGYLVGLELSLGAMSGITYEKSFPTEGESKSLATSIDILGVSTNLGTVHEYDDNDDDLGALTGIDVGVSVSISAGASYFSVSWCDTDD